MATIEERKLSVEFLYAAVFTMVTVMVWVGLELIRSLTTPATVSQVTAEELQPLSPELNVEVVNRLKSRQQISQEVLDTLEVSGEPLITGVTHASGSASMNTPSQQEATESGGI